MNFSRKNAFWVFLFALSLMANMFFIGMMTGRGFHHGPRDFGSDRGPPPSPIELMLGAAQGLSGKDRAVIERVYETYNVRARSHIEELHQAFDYLRDVLTAADYSPVKIREAHERLARADNVIKDDIEAVMLEVAKDLSPEGRRRFFQNMLPPPDQKHFHNPSTERGPPAVE